MTKYMVNGSQVYLGNDLDFKPLDKLPVATYMVALSMERGYYLTLVPGFTLPKKLYGNTKNIADRVLRTFADRPGTTGVLLNGLKGSGKSLAMKQISTQGLALGIPTVIVSSAYCGDGFNKFIQAIDQDCIILFDEFEKVYGKDEQNQLLTLLDGIYSTKKLFILTVNDKYAVNEYMNNRPGRIFYKVDYNGLGAQFIREYCEDRLDDKNKIDQIIAFASLFNDFNFDMLQALVEELNRYKEELKDALEILNIKYDGYSPNYDVTFFTPDGKPIDPKIVGPQVIKNIFSKEEFSFIIKKPEADGAEIGFNPKDDWLEEYLEDFGEENFFKYTVSLKGKNVTKNDDMSELIVRDEKVTVVFKKPETKQPAYFGYF